MESGVQGLNLAPEMWLRLLGWGLICSMTRLGATVAGGDLRDVDLSDRSYLLASENLRMGMRGLK